jgi:uncharacterized membrane protein
MAARHGLDWIVAGWGYFARMARPALLLTALLLAATLGARMLTSLRYASVLFGMLTVFYLAILALHCRLLEQGAAVPDLAAARALLRNGSLYVLAALAGVITLALDLLSNSMSVYTHAASVSALGIYFLFIKALSLLALMALWLAPALVVLDGAGPWRALALSLRATLRHFLPWLLWSLLAFVLCIVAAIPVGLGLLAALPTLACGAYQAWRDMFTA